MNKEQNLKELEQESFRDLNRDGFNEANLGIIFLLWFNSMYIGTPVYQLIVPGWLGLTIVIFFMVYLIFIFLYHQVYMKKYVYPRIGYVKLREVHSFKAKLGAIAIMILAIAAEIALVYMLSTDIITIDWVYRWIPVFFGLTACTFCFALKDMSGQNSYLLVGVLLTITAFALALAEFISADMVPIVYFDGWGIAFIVVGVIKFVLFIRKYPIIDTTEVVK
ncbi:MAG: hypothetical protein RTV72_05250 [Candidatus Thorarchaeota archaeon]